MTKIFISVVLLAAVQAAPPVPRQTPNVLGGTPRSIQSQTKDNQKPPQPVTPVIQDTRAAENPREHGQAENPKNGKNEVGGDGIFVTVNENGGGDGPWLIVFTGLLFLVGVGQAAILWRQAGIMKSQLAMTQPHLHVFGVRASWFAVGRRPVIFVKVVNSGQIAADNVSISMKVQFKGATRYYDKPQVMIIPANGWRECFIYFSHALDEATLEDLDSGREEIRVRGHVVRGDERIDYDYKYYQWPFKEPRPEGLRRFVPYGFSTTIQDAVVNLGGLSMGMNTSATVIRDGKEIPE